MTSDSERTPDRSSSSANDLPTPRQMPARKRRFSVIWLVPLLAIATIGLLWFNPDNLVFNPGNKPVGDSISAVAALTLWAFLGMESASVPAFDPANPFADLEDDLPWETGEPVATRGTQRGRAK